MEVSNLLELNLTLKEYEYLFSFKGSIVGTKNTIHSAHLLEDIKTTILPSLQSAKAVLIKFSANSRASPPIMDEGIGIVIEGINRDAELIVANSVDGKVKDGYIEYMIIGSGVGRFSNS